MILLFRRSTLHKQLPSTRITTIARTPINLRPFVAYAALAFCSRTNNIGSALSYSYAVEPGRFRQKINSQRYSHHSATSHSSSARVGIPFAPLARSNRSINISSYPRGGSLLTQATMASTSTYESTAVEACPKLDALRSRMKELDLDAYIVPSDDPHLSEYVPKAYMRRAFLSGFKGSAGTVVVTRQNAYLWTDSRYFNEASQCLNPLHWKLMKQGTPNIPTIPIFLARNAAHKFKQTSITFRVGIDPFLHPASFAKEVTDAFLKETPTSGVATPTTVGEIDTLDKEGNLIDPIWGTDRPPIPQSPFRIHPLQYSGTSVSQKIASVRKEMEEKGATLSVFCALDDIAYLLNVRAKGDIETCPVGIAYATVAAGDGEVTLYCDGEKVGEGVNAHLVEAGVVRREYEEILPFLQSHLDETIEPKVWIDQTRANYALGRVIPSHQLLNAPSAITSMKAVKNKTEIAGMRQAHLYDGVVMAQFISWLEHTILVERRTVSEVEVDEVLTGMRVEQPGFIECSFPTIAGVGPNGAIIHYRAETGTDLLRHLDHTQPILIDSGGQYECGTTDVTRTWHFGDATADFKEYNTRVLKGHIAVDQMVFPEGTPGFVLDVFARKALWDVGKDYGHGTGHGVGAALNVHEGPQSISPRWGNTEVLKKGMIVSNEPGYYQDGVCGIRIENLLEISFVNEADNVAFDQGLSEGDDGYPSKATGEKKFLKFNRLTMIPIQKNLIDLRIMSEEELDWIDSYHEEVLGNVAPLLEEGTPAMVWLRKACEKIER